MSTCEFDAYYTFIISVGLCFFMLLNLFSKILALIYSSILHW